MTIDDLQPRPIWAIFKQICSIPHPSKHEIRLRNHIQQLCESKGLETKVDATGNLFVYKPATAGMENRQTVAIQGHIDMVPQANADSDHDFVNDPIETVVDGDWLRAKGTTLGSDNGIGVAAGLAVMLSDDIEHPNMELLLTIEEETSMRGAFGLEPGYLQADILLNLDTEDEGELYVGCAGGADINIELELKFAELPDNYKVYEVKVSGLLGGHSGLDIHLGRGNANQIINRYLAECRESLDLKVCAYNGGTLRNAIPRESFTAIAVPSDKVDAFKASLQEFHELMKHELGKTEPNLNIEIAGETTSQKYIVNEQQAKIEKAIAACISAPVRMSDQFEGVVETSNNLAIVKTVNNRLTIQCLTRSLLNSARDYTCRAVAGLFELIGAQTRIEGAYPGWKPNPDSRILKIMLDGYEELFGVRPEIKVIHAGLECGLLAEPYPDIDMISFGPTIRGAHSPDERCHIPSVQKFWDYLLYTLKNIPEKQS
jgi:dipeptidase D